MTGIKRLILEAHRRSLWQVLAIYAVGSWVAFQVISTLWETLGLPDWVPGAAIVLFLIGLPIVLATAFVQEGAPGIARDVAAPPAAPDPALRSEPAASAPTPAANAAQPSSLKHVLTWNRSIRAGVLAFAVLGLGVTGFMGMRTLGIGPGATLMSSGVLEAREPILLANIGTRGADSVLADAATEALRVDLDQSTVVRLLESGRIRESLQRMQRPESSRIDEQLALELAQRLGLKAVLAGDLTEAGGAYVLTARLISPADGAALASFRETATDAAQVIAAVDRLSARLREKIGESFRTVRASEPLAQVTTTSLDALKKYSQALRASALDPDQTHAIALLREAVELDSTFGMAWRKLAAAYTQAGTIDNAKREDALARAYRFRDRMGERERYHTDALYMYFHGDDDASNNAYRAIIASWPDDHTALHNLAVNLRSRGDPEQAAQMGRRAIAADSTASSTYRNLMGDLAQLGQHAAIDTLVELYRARWPDHPQVAQMETRRLIGGGKLDEAEARARAWRTAPAVPAFWRAQAGFDLSTILHTRGRLAESERSRDEGMQVLARMNNTAGAMQQALNSGFDRIRNANDAARAIELVERALARYPLDEMAPANRPYGRLAHFYAFANRPAVAASYLAQWERERDANSPEAMEPNLVRAYGALHAGDAAGAFAALDAAYARGGLCRLCPVVERASFHDRFGQADSALAGYQRFIDDPAHTSSGGFWQGVVLERLAQLHDQRGNTTKAAEYYARFVELWEKADPELQPRVAAARQRLEQLVGRRG